MAASSAPSAFQGSSALSAFQSELASRKTSAAQLGALEDGMLGDEFRAVLSRQLNACGEELVKQHRKELQGLRKENARLQSRLSELLRHLEAQDHPAVWVVPEEPVAPQVQERRDGSRHELEDYELGAGSIPMSAQATLAYEFERIEESPQEDKEDQAGNGNGERALEPSEVHAIQSDIGSAAEEEAPRFVAREVWTKAGDVLHQGSIRRFRRTESRHHHTDGTITHVGGGGAVQWYMIHPQARARMLWSLMGLVCLCSDIVTVPVEVCFRIGDNVAFLIFESVSLCYWASDIPLNFFTGVHQSGYIELRPGLVARAYLRTWFFFDLILVLWEFAVLLNDMQAFEVVTVLRFARVLRLLRILRMAAIANIVNELLLFVNDSIFSMLGPLRMCMLFALCIHCLGCVWYAIGSNGAEGWVARVGIQDQDLFHRYIFSVCWTVMQFTGGPYNVKPETMVEQTFALFAAMLALVLFAVFVAETVHTVSELQGQSSAHVQRLCRQYLASRNISVELSRKLRRFFLEGRRGGFSRMKNVRERLEHEAKLLEDLPVVMQMDLYEEVRRPLLEQARLFADLHIVPHNTCALRELCFDVVTCMVNLPGELVFTIGDGCSRSLISESGTTVYFQGVLTDTRSLRLGRSHALAGGPPAAEALLQNGTPLRESSAHSILAALPVETIGSESVQFVVDHSQSLSKEEYVLRGRVISEAVLWTKWVHCGDLMAASDNTMLAMEAARFAEVMSNHAFIRIQAMRYVYRFIEYMNNLSDEDAFNDLLEVPEGLAGNGESGFGARFAKDHFIFISHFKKEAGTEATLLEEAFHRVIQANPQHVANEFRRPVFLDSSTLDDLSTLEKHVRRSHNLVVLLTPKLFTRPWCLVEMVIAIRSGVEIVPVEIVRPGLSFKYPDDRFYAQLTSGEGLKEEDIQVLRSQGIQLQDLLCIKKVFQKIALSFSPHKSLSIREAELGDILQRCQVREERARARTVHHTDSMMSAQHQDSNQWTQTETDISRMSI